MSSPFAIRLATETDVSAMVALANAVAESSPANFATEPEPVADWLEQFRATHRAYPWLVATSPGGGFAFAKAGPYRARGAYRTTAEVSVYVDEASRGRGVGGALYEELLRRLDAQGFVCIVACITVGQTASERLHARMGFRRVGVLAAAGFKQGAWHDVAFWERVRPPPAVPMVLPVDGA